MTLDLNNFLSQLVAGDLAHVAPVAVVVGVLIYALIELIDKIVSKDGQNSGLSADAQFWLALVLGFVVPLAAYILDALMNGMPVTFNGVFLAFAVGYAVSQGVHWVLKGSSKAARAADAGIRHE